jgi:hypothetical protein
MFRKCIVCSNEVIRARHQGDFKQMFCSPKCHAEWNSRIISHFPPMKLGRLKPFRVNHHLTCLMLYTSTGN